jgi:hypothetical protein
MEQGRERCGQGAERGGGGQGRGRGEGGFGKAAATCKGCHAAHREKLEDGSYKIK